jgi:glycosyltransferase involved in cell wall biosynthesis
VHGFIEDISPWLDGCRVSIAPIRYGAGVKGKVTMAMSCGLPVVATSIAVEGIHARDGFDIRVADSAEAFAEAVVELYEDEAQWNHIAQNALATMQDNFSFTAARRAIRRIFDL